VTSEAVAPSPAPRGFQAIIDLVRTRRLDKPAAPRRIDDKDGYSSARLICPPV
jgi:hypothetical protein